MNNKAFVSICVAIFVSMLGMGIVSPLMSVYATSMGATGFQLGVMYSGFALSRAIIQPFTGWFSDHKGRKNLMVIGLSIYTVVSLGYAFAANMYQLTSVRLLHGLASAMVMPIAQAYIGDICPKGKEDTYMGLYMMAFCLGTGTGPLLGGAIWDTFGIITPAFYIMAALAACGVILMVLFVPPTEPHIYSSNRKRAPMTVVLKDNKIRAVALYLGSRGIMRQGITAFIALFATKVLNLPLTLAGAIASIYLLSEALGQGIAGPIAKRFPRRPLIVFTATVASVLVFFVGRMGSFASLVALLIPLAIMTAAGRVPALAYNVELGAKYGRMGASMGVANSAQDLGHFFGPMAFGWAMDRFGIGSVFVVGGIICLASLPLLTYWLYQKETDYVLEGATTEPVQTQK